MSMISLSSCFRWHQSGRGEFRQRVHGATARHARAGGVDVRDQPPAGDELRVAPRLGAGDQDQRHGGVPRARVRGHRPRQRQPLLHAQPERHQQAEEEVQDHHREILQVLSQSCSSVVRAFAHGAKGRRIDPSWSGPIELFLVPASAP